MAFLSPDFSVTQKSFTKCVSHTLIVIVDTQKEIDRLASNLPDEMRHDFNSGVLQHIKRADYHFKQGASRPDDQYFTDTIYRTNQAFEGMLKEAYEVLTNSTSAKKTPYQIEQYFQSNSVFNSRVMNAFTRYRQEWRNPSAHDHRLFFGKEDAYLAILNVSAFVFILLDQIVEIVAYKSAITHLDSRPRTMPSVRRQEPAIEWLVSALTEFASVMTGHSDFKTGSQLVGALSAYLIRQIPELDVNTDPFIRSENGDVRPDMVIAHPNFKEKIVLELKSRYSKVRHDAVVDQVGLYLKAAGLRTGVVYYYTDSDEIVYEADVRHIGKLTVYAVVPKSTRSERSDPPKR